ncbi:VOC family protein [Georgenia sp. Z1491]|uniref:VOC family protein n=1 Tax=Georgenia sp. Z1491 TaxID=3416707 RepID=UPI003CE8BE06
MNLTRAVSEMGYLAIRTTDLEYSVQIAVEVLGLHVTAREVDRVYLAAAPVSHEIVYIAADHNAVDHIGLKVRDAAALAELRASLTAAGREIVAEGPLTPGVEGGFAVVGPDGFVFSLYLSMSGEATRHAPAVTKRFGHVNLHVTDLADARAFFADDLGFMTSDVIGNMGYFLRCNSEHHGIALLAGPGKLHHHAWEMRGVGDITEVLDRLDRLGEQRAVWGPVRHGAGRNIAGYYVEPPGDVVEVYTDMDQIYDDFRPPIVWEDGDDSWINRWGTYRGDNFRSHGLPATPRA